MGKVYRLVFAVFICCSAFTSVATAGEDSHAHLVGAIDKLELQNPPYKTWFEENNSNYEPDNESIKALAKSLSGVQVRVFMGTWCHDSKREVPRLFKVLEASNFDLNELRMVSLNLDKKTPNGLENGFDIQRTPTFIFMKNGLEIGRIVETPRESLEEDILKIVTGQEYKHSYE